MDEDIKSDFAKAERNNYERRDGQYTIAYCIFWGLWLIARAIVYLADRNKQSFYTGPR